MKDLVLVPFIILLGAWFIYYYYSGELFDFILALPQGVLSFVLRYVPSPPDLPYGTDFGPIFQEQAQASLRAIR